MEVEVLEVRTNAPARVEVTFIEEFNSGATMVVPPGRLKTPWSASVAFEERESAWRSLRSEPDDVEEGAVEAVVVEFLGQATKRGTICILDHELVDLFIGGFLDDLIDESSSIVDELGTNYGWTTALSIARQICTLKPDRVMSYVHAEEERGKRYASVGGSRTDVFAQQPVFALPSVEAAVYEEYLRPMLDLLRSWCGTGPSSLSDDLREVRAQSARFAELFVNAIALLADSGDESASLAMYQVAYPAASKSDWRKMLDVDAPRRRRWRASLRGDAASD